MFACTNIFKRVCSYSSGLNHKETTGDPGASGVPAASRVEEDQPSERDSV